jgi:hypothetical protein
MVTPFVEFITLNGETILIKLDNITLVKKNKREYPKFVDTFTVFVNDWSWKLDEEEGDRLYAKYKEWLTSARVK